MRTEETSVDPLLMLVEHFARRRSNGALRGDVVLTLGRSVRWGRRDSRI